MKDSPMKKATLIFIVASLLWIASGFVRTVSEERRGRRAEVMQEISSSLTPDQKIETPYLVVPTQETYHYDNKLETETSNRSQEVRPTRVDFAGEAKVKPISRGIFHAQAYELSLNGKAKFALPPESEVLPAASHEGGKVRTLNPYFLLPLSAKKGLQRFPVLKIAGHAKEIRTYSCEASICFDPGLSYEELRKVLHEVDLSLELHGMDEISFRSLATESSIKLQSNWPSPSFRGVHLPSTREVSKDGFTSEWKLVNTAVAGRDDSFSVRFMEPVDVYTLTDRATKYAILFIVSVFAGFFLVEVASNLRLHPLQYGLVGAALVVFYLLVLSFAEHMDFRLAYTISAIASTALIWFYLSAALRDPRRSKTMGVFLSGLYGMLYVILSAEDFALLFGSLLSFGLLAAIMIATRRMDWYQLSLGNAKDEVARV